MATINGTTGNDSLAGTASNDTINGLAGGDTLAGSAGTDFYDGGTGFDTLDLRLTLTGLTVNLSAGTLSGGFNGTFANIERVWSGDGNDSLTGTAGADSFSARGGNDTLAGGSGVDTLWGGAGADTFIFRETGTANADSIGDWTSGSDKLLLDDTVMTALGAAGNFAAGDARFWASSTGAAHDADDRILYNTTTRQVFYDADGNGSGAAVLIATLQTGATLAATDIVVGGSTPPPPPPPPPSGDQTINGTAGNDSLVGGSGNDTINGFDGNDTIDGGAGADSMTGGAHADIYFVDNAGDVIVELENGGFDTVNASVSYTLAAWVNNLNLTGSAAINGTGNELPNAINGNGGDNVLDGREGDDTLAGGSGNDSVIGGEGVDRLEGAGGNDTLVGGEANFYEGAGDTLDGGVGDDRFVLGRYDHNVLLTDAGGVDTVVANSGWWTLASGFENLELGFDWGGDEGVAVGTGNAANNIITGFSGWWVSNELDGADGNDTLIGGDGDDVFKFEAGSGNYGTDFADGRGGFDTLSFANAASAVVIDWRIGLVNGGGTGGSGSATFANMELIEGSAFADHITGPNGSGWGDGYYYDEWDYYEDWYYYGPQVRAGAGDDTLAGGDNYDYFFGEDGDDHLSAGTGGAYMDGGAGADTFIGGASYDEIEAALGSDSISTGGGTDYVYLYTDGHDTVDGGDGTDYVYLHTFAQSAVIVDLGAGTVQGGDASGGGGATLMNVEGATGGGFDDRLIGNSAANYFSAVLGNDTLLGGGGNDTLYGGFWSPDDADDDVLDGGAGNDYLYAGSGVDQFVFSAAAGEAHADFIDGFTSGEDQLRLDPAVYTQLGASGRFGWGDERFYAASGASSGHDASDRIIFDTATGNLYYDADGSGAGAALRIATLWSNPQATDIYVGFGEDTGSIRGTSGNDTLTGTDGDDLIDGLGGNDSIDGLGGGDGILGGSGNDNLSGGAGNDSLDGGFGSDTMAGGLDSDIFIVDSTGDVVTELEGGGAADEVQTSLSYYALPAWVENLTFTGTGSTVSDGNALGNIITGNAGANTLRGGLGDDTISGEAGGDWLYGEAGDDVLLGGIDGDQLLGGDGNDSLEGGDGFDGLYGQAGNDTLNGGADSDSFNMMGFPGDYGNDVIDGGAGSDIVFFDSIYAESAVVVDLAAGTLSGGGAGGAGSATIVNVERVVGTRFADSFTGGGGNDSFTGRDGNDTLTGGGGNDGLGGGLGADLMTGGDGNDTMHGDGGSATQADGAVDTMIGGLGDDFYFAHSQDVISDSGGIDSLHVYESWTLAEDFENLSLSTGDFTGIGNSKNNQITGVQGNNLLDGRAGNDFMSAGDGHDTLLGGDGNDYLSAGFPWDSVFGSDRIEGGSGNDTLSGLQGSDTLAFAHFGAANADVIWDFALGSNHIELDGAAFTNVGSSGTFAAGDARFWSSTSGTAHDTDDRVIYNTTNGQLWYDADGSGSGVAQLIATLQNAPSLSASQISVINGSAPGQVITGTSGNDTLTGTAGDDAINGLAGNDSIIGGGGSDSLDGGDGTDTIDGGDGSDTYVATSGDVLVDSSGTDTVVTGVSWTLGAGFENLTLSGTAAASATGNSAANVISGNSAGNVLTGGAGNDTLTGGPGGGGADRFVFSEAPGAANADLLTEFTSTADKIVLDGTVHTGIGATGNFAPGDARFWSSTSGTAHDADDRVIYNTSTGQLWYDADGNGAGAAQLIATVQDSWTLAAADIEVINGGPAAGQVINGTTGNDNLVGAGGNDTINGLAGNDTLAGSGGNDSYDGGTGFDTLDLRATLIDLSANLSAGTLSGGFNGTLAGMERVWSGDGNDSLTGTGAGDSFSARGGSDTLAGGAGVDTLWGGTQADTFIFRETGTANADTIGDWASNSDTLALDNATMTALGANGDFVAGDARFAAGAGFTSGRDATDRVVFDTSTGRIYYDADGSGAGAAQLIATLQSGAALAATDIAVL